MISSLVTCASGTPFGSCCVFGTCFSPVSAENCCRVFRGGEDCLEMAPPMVEDAPRNFKYSNEDGGGGSSQILLETEAGAWDNYRRESKQRSTDGVFGRHRQVPPSKR